MTVLFAFLRNLECHRIRREKGVFNSFLWYNSRNYRRRGRKEMYTEYIQGLHKGETFKALRSFLKSRNEEKARIDKYTRMSERELAYLEDEEFYEALEVRLEERLGNKEVSEALAQLTVEERIFYVLNLFDMEVQNGGLCQFYVNSSRDVAPLVAECLHTVGAESYQKLYEGFNKKNGIDVTDLTSFIMSDIDEFEEQKQRYDFDAFDDTYYCIYEEEPLNQKIIQYQRRIR